MIIYADTSVLVSWFHPADRFALAVTAWCREQEVDFLWNPILRLELRHALRRLKGSYAPVAWRAYRASERSRCLRLSAHRVEDYLESSDELSARHAKTTECGTWDCVHVAAALREGVELFATADTAQAELAKSAGIRQIKLFT